MLKPLEKAEQYSKAKKTPICPGLTPLRTGVSAALRSRVAGEGRASWGDPGCCLGAAWALAPRAAWGGCCLTAVLVDRFASPPKLLRGEDIQAQVYKATA